MQEFHVAKWLKEGAEASGVAEIDRNVQEVVEKTLTDIGKRVGDAVCELSRKFDKWDREDFRLTQDESDQCLGQLTARDIRDIVFAQQQVRNFAQMQRSALQDVEVETLPGVILGHKTYPFSRPAVTCREANTWCWHRRICR